MDERKGACLTLKSDLKSNLGSNLTGFARVKNFFGVLLSGIVKDWKVILTIMLCNVLSAFTVANFILPYRFPDLGVTGVAFLVYYVIGFPPSVIIAAGNVILLAWGRRNLNERFLWLTICSIASFTITLPIFSAFPLDLPHDRFMATVISGVLRGVAGGIILNVGGSGGGTDIIAMVLRRRYGIEVGQFSIAINLCILALSLGVVGMHSVVYGAVGLYVFGITIDSVMMKFDRRKQAFIITNIPDEVSVFINSHGKGVTRIEAKGMYTGESRPVLMSLLEPRHVVVLKGFLQEKDPNAFVSICDAAEVLGRGFKSWESL